MSDDLIVKKLLDANLKVARGWEGSGQMVAPYAKRDPLFSGWLGENKSLSGRD